MTTTRRTALPLLGAALVLSAAPALAQSGGFTSGGVPITVERFDPPGAAGGRPAVILLHGADGPGERYRFAARQVASAGYPVFMVHYLDRTGQSRASFGSIGQNLPVWAQTTREAVRYVAGQPGVDPNRIGILGVSLGGGLGILTASAEPRVRAFVDYFGFVPSGFQGGRLPPTLILHGDADRIVPVTNAARLQAILQAQGTPHEVQIYPGEGHGFSAVASADAARRIAGFFGRTLGSAARARTVTR